jgi:uncharacterized short protein YbdD (DUF466 family)
MSQFSMTCTCGHVISVDALDREEAIQKMKGMMTPSAIAQHMSEKHPGDPVMSTKEVHTMIEQGTRID